MQYFLALRLMVANDATREQLHYYNLKEEIAGRYVAEAEEYEPCGAEIECQHSVPRHYLSGQPQHLLSYFGRDIL